MKYCNPVPINIARALGGINGGINLTTEKQVTVTIRHRLVLSSDNADHKRVYNKMIEDRIIYKNGFITGKGILLMKQLMYDKEMSQKGYPFDQFTPKRARRYKFYTIYKNKKIVFVGDYFGERAYSNGHLLLAGKPNIPYPKIEKSFKSLEISKAEFNKKEAVTIGFTLAVYRSDAQMTGIDTVWMSDGNIIAGIQSVYYNYIIQWIRDPVFYLMKKEKAVWSNSITSIDPIRIESKGKFAGIVMPLRKYSIPENINKFINEKFKKEQT